MPEKRVVLVTGVAGYFGGRVAGRLLSLPGLHVIGLDARAPRERLRGLDFVQADVRNSLLPDLFKDEGVEAVCHLAFIETDRPNEAAFDVNVMGTIRVMGACAEAGVQRVVLRSSTMVYGARPDNSAFLTEAQPLRGDQRNGTVRDLLEIEAFCNGFCRQFPGTPVTLLRFPGIVGPGGDSPLTRFLREVWTPILLGFDPMLQVIHEDDVVGALVHALVAAPPSGVYNVAAESALPLTQIMTLAGKMPLPLLHPGIYLGRALLSGAGLHTGRYLPIEPDYLRYSWIADLARMHKCFGFAPHYTAAEALREFAGHQRLVRYLPEKAALAYDEERLRDTIERRRRDRTGAAVPQPGDEHPPDDAVAGEVDAPDADLPDGTQDRLPCADEATPTQGYEVEPNGH